MPALRRPWANAATFLGGLVVWAAHFGLVYGIVSVACGRGWGAGPPVYGIGLVPLLVVGATVPALAAVAALLAVSLRRLRAAPQDEEGREPGLGLPDVDPPADARLERFLASSTALVAALSLVAIAFDALPALLVPACP